MYSISSKKQQILKEKKPLYLTSVILILITFVTTFFPRIIAAAGAPAAINFLHFLIAPFTLFVAITKTRTKDKTQIAISWEIIIGCVLLLGVMIASALLNKAGEINVFLTYMILAEPFLVLLAIICIPLSKSNYKKIRAWLLVASVINLFIAFIQKPLIDSGRLPRPGLTPEDAIQGVFYISGAGNYVSCSISLAVALYYFFNAKTAPMWQRIFWISAGFYQVLISDSKQILVTFFLAWLLLLFTQFNNFGKTLTYAISFIVILVAFIWAVQNLDLPGLDAFKYWAGRTHLYGLDGLAVNSKLEGVRIVLSHYQSPLNWLLGLGPGHTIGRVGGWVLRDYQSMLVSLGATIHPASIETWNALQNNWLVQESSFFIPMFSWAGIWGDLGFLGLGVYLYLCYIVWSRIAKDDFSRFNLMTLFVYGFIITQMEEPAQTMVVAIIIGLQWHERRIAKQERFLADNYGTDTDI